MKELSVKEISDKICDLYNEYVEASQDLEEKREALLRVEKYKEAAVELKAMFDAFVGVGFTEERAWLLTEKCLEKSFNTEVE